ncbi:hypothetical protein NMY22_g5160 [Coprinellus aureogranulatus]|nr:hypothetical protein NMY22_g5160 [Coprinellus aureogranulatus]
MPGIGVSPPRAPTLGRAYTGPGQGAPRSTVEGPESGTAYQTLALSGSHFLPTSRQQATSSTIENDVFLGSAFPPKYARAVRAGILETRPPRPILEVEDIPNFTGNAVTATGANTDNASPKLLSPSTPVLIIAPGRRERTAQVVPPFRRSDPQQANFTSRSSESRPYSMGLIQLALDFATFNKTPQHRRQSVMTPYSQSKLGIVSNSVGNLDSDFQWHWKKWQAAIVVTPPVSYGILNPAWLKPCSHVGERPTRAVRDQLIIEDLWKRMKSVAFIMRQLVIQPLYNMLLLLVPRHGLDNHFSEAHLRI